MSSSGTVTDLWRFPVKSMQGERVDHVHVGHAGVLGDRAWAVVDATDGTPATAKFPGRYADLLNFRARYGAEPEPGTTLPPVVVELPDGSVLHSDDRTVHTALSELLGHAVELRYGGPFVDLAPAHLITSACLEHLAALAPSTDFDVRRYRPTALLDLDEPAHDGFPEDDWVGRTVAVGSGVELVVTQPTSRCVMNTLAQPGLAHDSAALSTVTRHHRLEVPGLGVQPCAGVYADVAEPGTIAVGDAWQIR